jgi:8-oxo-dGTP pyrophosphatase MutT (NUDIX family)
MTVDPDMPDKSFFEHLYNEKLQTQQARNQLTIQKLVFATTLLGLGSLNLKVGQFDLSILIYLVPWVALIFDFYIMGEDYSVKRIGAFLNTHSPYSTEHTWEGWVSRNRDPFAPWAMPILTTFLFLGSTIILLSTAGISNGPFLWIWLLISGLPSWISFAYYRHLRSKVQTNTNDEPIFDRKTQRLINHLIKVVEKSDFELNNETFDATYNLFLKSEEDFGVKMNIRKLAPQMDNPKYLLCVNSKGQPIQIPETLLANYKEIFKHNPHFKNWFCIKNSPQEREETLLLARWLCHLVGFRHTSVHLFIDHPLLKNHTILQIRSADKNEAPGCFDLPVAGHVDDLRPPLEALYKESMEELGLDLGRNKNLEHICDYPFSSDKQEPFFRNNEYRIVYHLKPDKKSWLEIKPNPEEVAGTAVFSYAELEKMIKISPERFASGITASYKAMIECVIK